MSVTTDVLIGDSEVQGTAGSFSMTQGGAGSWAERAANAFADIRGLGPLVSSGVRCAALGIASAGSTEVSYSAGWTDVVGTNTWDRFPAGIGRWANGSTKTVTYTVPVSAAPVVGFALWLVDKTAGADPSISINGGSFTNLGQTWTGSNKLLLCYIAQTLKAGDTIVLRCANAAATGVDCAPLGPEWFYLDPTSATTNGHITHNVAVNSSKLADYTGSTNGDRLAFLDRTQWVLGTGWNTSVYDPINATRDFIAAMWINDSSTSASTWNTNLGVLKTKSGTTSLAVISPWEVDTVWYSTASQSAIRAQTKLSASSVVFSTIDLRDELVNEGFSGFAALESSGFLHTDGLHPSPAGHQWIAERLYGFLRQTMLSSTVSENRNVWGVGKSGVGSATDGFGGHPYVDQTQAFSGIAPTSALGTLTAQQTAPFTGIAPTSAVGTLTLQQTAPLTGIAPASAIGALQTNLIAGLTGIAPTSGLGTLTAQQTELFAGIAPTSAIGALTLHQAVGFAGIAPTSALGALQINTSADLNGIASTAGLGSITPNQTAPFSGVGPGSAIGTLTTSVGPVTVSLAGIAPTSAVGAFGSLDQTAPLSGLGSTVAFGALTAVPGNVDVALSGIAPTSGLGAVNIVTGTPIDLAGIDPASAVGSPTFAFGAVTVALTGIGSSSAVGALTPAAGPVTIAFGGIAPTSALGTLTAAPGTATAVLGGIAPTDGVGTLSPVIAGIASFAGIASSTAIGHITINTATLIIFSGIVPTSALGIFTAAGPAGQFIPLVGIGSTVVFGHIILGGIPRAALLVAMPDWAARVAAVPDMACTVEAT